MKQYIHNIRVAANVGLITSVSVSLASILFFFVSDYRFYMDNAHFQTFMYIGSLLIVLNACYLLWAVRKNVPRIRQTQGVEEKFKMYSRQVCNVYYISMTVVLIECAIIVLSNNNSLIMFLLLLVVMMFLIYPNIYRMQVDMGLNDGEMKELFGDAFIANANNEEPDANHEESAHDENE